MFGLLKGAFHWARTKDYAAPGELTLAHLDHFGVWLDFDPVVAARYETDTGADRVAHLRSGLILGLVFYDAYFITDFLLLRDLPFLAPILRLLVITPASLGVVWLVRVVSARLRELIVTIAMINAMALPLLLFHLSHDPLSLYSVAELPLGIVFGSLMLVLRFPAAFAFSLAIFLMALPAVLTKTDLSPTLKFVFLFQIFTAFAFVLAGNYKIEALRRRSYLQGLREQLRADLLDKDRQVFATLSKVDALTGIGNRRAFDDAFLTKNLSGASYALFMIDVDFFKVFDDTYGHPRGDACLRLVAAALQAELRSGLDVVARYGGEEFAVILAAGTIDEAKVVADRLRTRVEAAKIPHTNRVDGFGVVTVSIGCVFVDAGCGRSTDAIVADADAALYDAKRRGRNNSVLQTSAPTIDDATTLAA